MFRFAQIFCLILLISSPFAQQRETNYNLAYPKFIPYNSSFDVSLTLTNSYPEADFFELLIIPEKKLILNKAEFKSPYEITKLKYSKTTSEDFFGESYLLKIELNDSLRSEGTVFQVLLNFRNEQQNSSQIKFKGTFKDKDSIIAYLTPHSDEINNEDFIIAKLEFYKPQKISEKALLLEKNSSFRIDVEKNFKNNFLLDFWIKFNEPDIQFLKILRKEFETADFILSINQFQMFSVLSDKYNQTYFKPFFISNKSWNHVTILIDKTEETINFYCNGYLISKNQLPSLFEDNNLRFIFENSTENKSYNLDLLRIIDLNNSVNLSFNNRHSINFNLDSSSLAGIYKFDSQNELLTENKNLKLEFLNTKLIKSDAPIFARSPELNINLLGNSYELEWKGGDYKQAQYYILEKSSGNKPYIQIHSLQADNTQEKTYSFIDVPEESEVVYYRIKQQNFDGSIVYSSQLKVGQGISEPFTLGQNYPNPFNPKTSIEVEIIEDSEIEIIIYSLDGREILKLFKGSLSKGMHKFDFDGEGLPSGIYLFKVAAPNFTQTKKMILTK
ncbi:MAG TPA: T9SS type A sorting domain-containing protein [Ignavibacteriaceae bacterium]|nr:T9SS type A sorting domain-containing protein [Ignavibacteriaceae bacterium]